MTLSPKFMVTQSEVRLSATHPLRVQRTTTRQVLPHGHDYYEIGVVCEGTAAHRTSDGRTVLRPGSILIVPPGPVHAFEGERNFQITNVYYLAEWLLAELRLLKEPDGLVPLFLGASLFPNAFPTPIRQMEMGAAPLADCLRELKGIEMELQSATPSRIFLKAMFLKFLVFLSRAFVQQQGRPCGFQFRREVWMTLDWIENSLENAQPFRVEETARRLGMSAAHLSRLFKQETRCSPREYFQNRRIQRACTYLLNPEPTITELAYQLGFSDAAHFCRLFTRFQKCSPRAYRRRYASR